MSELSACTAQLRNCNIFTGFVLDIACKDGIGQKSLKQVLPKSGACFEEMDKRSLHGLRPTHCNPWMHCIHRLINVHKITYLKCLIYIPQYLATHRSRVTWAVVGVATHKAR